MTIIYIVTERGGAYEDHWTRNVGARHTQEDADALADACNASNARCAVAWPQVHKTFHDALKAGLANPLWPDGVQQPDVEDKHLASKAYDLRHRSAVELAGKMARKDGERLGLTEEDLKNLFTYDFPSFEVATYEIEELDIQ